MSLQNKTILRYRQFFPQDTLREISLRTGIQITRVFRLMNGKTMKVGELEAFETAVSNKIAENPGVNRFQMILDEAVAILTNEEIAKLADYMERRIVNRKYSQSCASSIFKEESIA